MPNPPRVQLDDRAKAHAPIRHDERPTGTGSVS